MKNKIVIVGGELFNKGAQAMTFVTVNEISKRYPECEIVLLSQRDFKRPKEEKDKYKFKISGMDTGCLFYNNLFLYILISLLKNTDKNLLRDFKNLLNETKFMIDISGYQLSSDWGWAVSVRYLLQIKCFALKGIPVYLFPQSFGPFLYRPIFQFILDRFIKKYMSYPKAVYAREKEGFEFLTKYNLKNVRISPDLVLLNKEIDEDNIFKTKFLTEPITVLPESIAVLPNMRLLVHGDKESIINIYKELIQYLLENKLNVYILRHSHEDLEMCNLIKDEFKSNDNVKLLKQEISCIEYSNLVKKFKFLIAARYHSIVHAYKEGVPCIIFGWATKYHELAELFAQSDYQFEIRTGVNTEKVLAATENMLKNYEEESKQINSVLKIIQKNNNIFNILNE